MADATTGAPATPPGAPAPGTPAPGTPAPGTPEYNSAMAAVADKAGATVNGQQPAAAPEAPQRPAGVPEKFWDAKTGQVNVTELLKSYTELERARTAPPTTPPAQQPANQPAAPVVVKGKADMAALTAEFATNGKLSDASYTALEAAGLPRAMVDSYIEGQKALQSSRDAKGFEAAGGEESFTKMSTWAASALSPAEVAALNRALAADEGSMLLAIAGLKAKYEAANGREPALIGGPQGQSQGVTPYQSQAEMVAAMQDPRYGKDEAYRQSVAARIAGMTNMVVNRR